VRSRPEDSVGEPVREPIFDLSAADEVSDEIEFHLEMRTRDLIAQGMPPDAARRAARERFNDVTRVTAELHQLARQREHAVKRTRYVINLGQDIRFALRMLCRRPAFALLAVVTIGLGIGAATSIYSVVDGVMLRPLPFNDPDKLVAIWVTEQRFRADATLNSWWDAIVMGHEEYDAIREQATTVRDVALWGRGGMMLITPDGPVQLSSVRATSNLLTTLQVRPALGRGFVPGEDALNGPRVAMLSWEEWQGRWHGDTSMVGRGIQLGAYTWTVVGILPRGLRLDRSAPPAAIWTPALRDSGDISSNHNRSYAALARLKSGTTIRQATAELSRVLGQVANRARGTVNGAGVAARVEQWQADQTRSVRASLWILLGAVVLLLLIACVSVATLMLGEAARRVPEISARAALGAAPGRIARQLMTESLAIATLGAAFGGALAIVGVRVLVAMAPAKIPGLADVRLDWRVMVFAMLCAAGTGVLFGLAPALMLLRRGDPTSVRIGTGQTPRRARALQHGLVAAEMALSLVLLTGCVLLGRSLKRLSDVAPGFDAQNIHAVQFLEQRAFQMDDDRVARYYPAAVRAIATIPGVSAVSAISSVPFLQGGSSSPVRTDAREYGPEDRGANAQQRTILPNYFHTMGITMVAGRAFDENDRAGSEPVVIVSEAEARRDWPGMSPIGHRLHWQGGWRTVVGLVRDVKYTQLSRPDEPTLYVPLAQSPGSMMLVVRGTAGTPLLGRALRERLGSIDAAVTIASITPVTRLIGKSYSEERYRALLASLFGILASILSAVGIYGVVSRAVARRMRETGIRIALGSPTGALTRLLMRETVIGVGIGLAIGLPLALGIAGLLKPYLFGIAPNDPIAFGAATVALAGTAMFATIQPAKRAGRTDPVVVLRSD
jgi:putative ABC transport system permease protein